MTGISLTHLLDHSMKILILGGDGFCGWPTALHLSAHGHDVTIVDNFERRRIDERLEIQSLTPISPLKERIATWQALTKKFMYFYQLDVACQAMELLALIKYMRPDVIIHFAEIRAAPYSMKSWMHKMQTVSNNVNATHNLLAAIVESGLDIHLVHLGTMGVYGYGTAGEALPEGYTTMRGLHDDTPMTFRYPPNPGSVYHMTKVLDAEMFAYYAKNDRLRITDLHQGIIWGTNTIETKLHPTLVNRFDYDGDYGTVLNRFLVEGAIGHPLTVHGTGGQTRAFIHIQNSVECIRLAIENPPKRGERVKIFNQMTETHRVLDLAVMVAALTGAQITAYENPRNEAGENELIVENKQFLALGLKPITLESGLIHEILNTVRTNEHRVNHDKIRCTSKWIKP